MKSLGQLQDLSGRRALVTGGAGHIALAVAESLLELGAELTLLDLDAEACRSRVEDLAAGFGRNVASLGCDLGDEAATRQAAREAVGSMGGLDILVHSAAYVGTTDVPGWAVPLGEQTVEAWDAAQRVNVTAPFVLVQETRTALEASGHGSVVLFSSIYGLVAPDMRLYEGTSMANPTGFGVSKAGVLQLTRYLATELAPRVRVNALTPGGVRRGQPTEFVERYTERTPMARMATEEDIKGAVAYLASDLSAYVTGQNLVVDGGWTAW